MFPILLLALLSSAPPAAPCPDDGRVRFYRSKDGFEGFTLLGDASYTSLFEGTRLEVRGSPGPASGQPPSFAVDDLKVAWELVPDRIFPKAKGASDEERLDAFHAFQTQRLRQLSQQRKIVLAGLSSYDPHRRERVDGRPVSFRIWRALLGKKGKQHVQYWVATSRDGAIVLLSVLVDRPSDEPKVKRLIDAYMAGFGPVDASTCARIAREAPRVP